MKEKGREARVNSKEKVKCNSIFERTRIERRLGIDWWILIGSTRVMSVVRVRERARERKRVCVCVCERDTDRQRQIETNREQFSAPQTDTDTDTDTP